MALSDLEPEERKRLEQDAWAAMMELAVAFVASNQNVQLSPDEMLCVILAGGLTGYSRVVNEIDNPTSELLATVTLQRWLHEGHALSDGEIDLEEYRANAIEAGNQYARRLKGWDFLPRNLTAENGAKAALIGEFSEQIEVTCDECSGCNPDCEFCDGKTWRQSVPVSWTTIKEIYAAAVAHFRGEDFA